MRSFVVDLNRCCSAEVAYRAGIEPQNLRKYELGRQEMRISMLMRIAEALEISTSELLEFDSK